jgi:hypothetical protein
MLMKKRKTFLIFRQSFGVGCIIWFTICRLFDGCYRKKSHSTCLFSNESFYRLDSYDGRISNLAIVCRSFPTWPWSWPRNSNMSCLYLRDMQTGVTRCLRVIPTNFYRLVVLTDMYKSNINDITFKN